MLVSLGFCCVRHMRKTTFEACICLAKTSMVLLTKQPHKCMIKIPVFNCVKDICIKSHCIFSYIFIVNVHLIFNFFQEPDVHALQLALFFQQLHKILPESLKHTTPWVVCGDFNMHPNFPVYEMLRNGKLHAESIEMLNPVKWKHPDLTRQNEVRL